MSRRQTPPNEGPLDNKIEYDAQTDTYRTAFDGRSESVSTVVTSLVASVSDTDLLDLPSLYSIVDPDALDALMNPASSGNSFGDTCVTFTLDDHDVAVHSYGVVTVRGSESDDETSVETLHSE